MRVRDRGGPKQITVSGVGRAGAGPVTNEVPTDGRNLFRRSAAQRGAPKVLFFLSRATI